MSPAIELAAAVACKRRALLLSQAPLALIAIALFASACGASADGAPRSANAATGRQTATAAPLTVTAASTPPLPVRGYGTEGTYPEVRGEGVDLDAVNTALRSAVAVDQRDYLPYARRQRAQVEGPSGPSYLSDGVYRTAVDRMLISASTTVVSALIPRTREVIAGTGGGDGWISVTVSVPSATRVSISDLFSNPDSGLRAFAQDYRRALQRRGTRCFDTYPDFYAPSAHNYRHFALTPTGLAVGVSETGACGAWSAIVPYDRLRAHLSDLGKQLVAGVRAPR